MRILQKIGFTGIIIFLLFIKTIVFATDNTVDSIIENQKEKLNLSDIMKQAEKYTEDTFEDINFNNLLSDTIKGKINKSTLYKSLPKLFSKELKEAIVSVFNILVIIVIHSILKSISENLGNSSTGQIAYYVEYILLVSLLIQNFSEIISVTRESIQHLTDFLHALFPILLTLMLTTGNFVTSNVVQITLLVMINFIGTFFTKFVLPVISISIVLSVISNFSDKVQIEKLAKFLKSATVWVIGIILTIFVCTLGLEGTITSGVDGLTAKTTKAAVSNFIPVVGKVLGDSVDTVIGCASILKNAIGIFGVIIVIGIVLKPIIKLLLMFLTYYIASAFCEVVADKKIVGLLSNISDIFKLLLAILCSISVMVIIGITIVLKITNSSLMYR